MSSISTRHVFIEVELETLLLPFITDRQSWASSVKLHLDVSSLVDLESRRIRSCLVQYVHLLEDASYYIKILFVGS